MKKLFSMLLALTVLFASTMPVSAATGYTLENIDAFTLKDNKTYTSPVRVEREGNSSLISAFHTMIGSAGASVDKPAGALEVARVTAERGGKHYSYILLKEGDKYYLTRGTRCRTMRYSDFDKLVQAVKAKYGAQQSGRIQFTATGDNTYLGEVVVLKITGTTNADALATWSSNISFTRPPKFFRQNDGSQLMLFPVAYTNKPGQHWVEVACAGEKARYTINAKDKSWQRQDLTVDPNTTSQTVGSQRANEEFEREISPIRGIADDKAHWSGRFILPCSDDKVTTQFGMVRYVNGELTSVRHGAIDLAVPLGTPVKATGGGRVLYSGYLQLTGNTIVIEHGYGLKSWYYHMDSRNVETGAMVSQGQQIGKVGTTGFSTGPHLHFGMSINNVFINPYTAINSDLLADIGRQ